MYKKMHESNGLRFDIIITSRQLKVKEQHSGVQEISHSYHAVNWGFCRLALFFLTAGFTQKIEINKPLLKIDTADTWSLKYVVIRDFTGL